MGLGSQFTLCHLDVFVGRGTLHILQVGATVAIADLLTGNPAHIVKPDALDIVLFLLLLLLLHLAFHLYYCSFSRGFVDESGWQILFFGKLYAETVPCPHHRSWLVAMFALSSQFDGVNHILFVFLLLLEQARGA